MNYEIFYTPKYYKGYPLYFTGSGIIFLGFLCGTLWDVDRIIDTVLPQITQPTYLPTINH